MGLRRDGGCKLDGMIQEERVHCSAWSPRREGLPRVATDISVCMNEQCGFCRWSLMRHEMSADNHFE